MKFSYQSVEYSLPCLAQHSEFIAQNMMIYVRPRAAL